MIIPPYLALVDDDESVTRALKRLLKVVGLDIRVFGSGLVFLEAVAERPPEVAILDVQMPDLSGLDVQERLVERGVAVPILFITAFDDEEVRRRALARGAAGFISKPFERQALLDQIAAVWQRAPKPATASATATATRLVLQSRGPATHQPLVASGGADFELTDLRPCPFCHTYPRLDKKCSLDSRGRAWYVARIVCPRCNAEVACESRHGFTTAAAAASDASQRWNSRGTVAG